MKQKPSFNCILPVSLLLTRCKCKVSGYKIYSKNEYSHGRFGIYVVFFVASYGSKDHVDVNC